MLQAGWRVFQELRDRTQTSERELKVYREVLIPLAIRQGVQVPDFAEEGRELDTEQLRTWLGQVMAGLSEQEQEQQQKSRGGQSRSRAGGSRRGRGEGRVLSTRGGRKRSRSADGEDG